MSGVLGRGVAVRSGTGVDGGGGVLFLACFLAALLLRRCELRAARPVRERYVGAGGAAGSGGGELQLDARGVGGSGSRVADSLVSRIGQGEPGGLTIRGDGSGVTLRGEAGAGGVGSAATCRGTLAISDLTMLVPGSMGVGGTASGAKIS
jgi:hypothetical protein